MNYGFLALLIFLCKLVPSVPPRHYKKILNIVILLLFLFLFISDISESWRPFLLCLFCQLPTLILSALSHISPYPPSFLYILLCHLLPALMRGWLLGGTWVYPPAHQDMSECAVQLPWAGFYAEKLRVPRPGGNLASPSRSLWLQDCRPGLWDALQNKPAAEFIYSLAVDPSDAMVETTGIGWGRSCLVHLSLLHFSVVQYWEPFLPPLPPSKMHSIKFGWSLCVPSPRKLSTHEVTAEAAGTASPQTTFYQSCIAGQGKELWGHKSSSRQLHQTSHVPRHQCQGFRFAAPALVDLQLETSWLPQSTLASGPRGAAP